MARHLKVKHETRFVFPFGWIACTMTCFHGKCGPICAQTQNWGCSKEEFCWLLWAGWPSKDHHIQGLALPGRLRGQVHANPNLKCMVQEPEGPFTILQWYLFLAWDVSTVCYPGTGTSSWEARTLQTQAAGSIRSCFWSKLEQRE